ncbi:hypothetical protein ROJ8625_03626 [Roseivivax jejudonensis]|uniref:Uncharacterized protein n=1 Tax=Roseivivax jejudonensis TaxID=1529041 RepID=A0A1X7A3M5_9RHOB|nr:hypothetical protein [Roseivivax jejudonensis]SLN69679.1 hypothetical protein ROJ8625_03626 [Roseivivax jejudonensis]
MTISKSTRRALVDLFEDADRQEAEKKMMAAFGPKLSKVIDSLHALDLDGLAWLFAAAEFHASSAAAREIAKHVMRPDETTVLVEKLRAEAEAQKAARRAERDAKRAEADKTED